MSTVYKSLKDSIDPKNLTSYFKSVKKVKAETGFTLHEYDTVEVNESSESPTKKDTLNWPVAILFLIFLFVGILNLTDIVLSQKYFWFC